jgi:hypothetical protein
MLVIGSRDELVWMLREEYPAADSVADNVVAFGIDGLLQLPTRNTSNTEWPNQNGADDERPFEHPGQVTKCSRIEVDEILVCDFDGTLKLSM